MANEFQIGEEAAATATQRPTLAEELLAGMKMDPRSAEYAQARRMVEYALSQATSPDNPHSERIQQFLDDPEQRKKLVDSVSQPPRDPSEGFEVPGAANLKER